MEANNPFPGIHLCYGFPQHNQIQSKKLELNHLDEINKILLDCFWSYCTTKKLGLIERSALR